MKNLPQKFLDEMKVLFKQDYDKFINTYNNPSYYGLRANTLKISKLELKAIADFIGEEITYDNKYINASLALNPYTSWI